ncbi:MAG: hypothetical protein RLZZ474_702 [Bacteroidota bacterium]|jgi:hypothetical protein
MKMSSRRAWLKGMTLAALGTVAYYDLSAKSKSISLSLSLAEEDILHRMMGGIIPESSIPGAVSLGVPTFVKTMLKDCYEPKAQDAFRSVLAQIPAFYKGDFNQASGPALEAFLFELEQGKHGANAQKALATLKGLTIQGYVTSEYVMVNHLNYQMAPGFWNPCVPVNK